MRRGTGGECRGGCGKMLSYIGRFQNVGGMCSKCRKSVEKRNSEREEVYRRRVNSLMCFPAVRRVRTKIINDLVVLSEKPREVLQSKIDELLNIITHLAREKGWV